MGLIGDVKKMDVDGDGKASGAFLRARVAVDLAKPLRRGVLLKTDKAKPPDWFDLQYEKLPFFCHSCGLMGHGDLECATPAQRNALGKLPYDIALRAPEDRKKKLQGLAQAAAETFGSASSSSSRQQRRSASREEKNAATVPEAHVDEHDGKEVVSPLNGRNRRRKMERRRCLIKQGRIFSPAKQWRNLGKSMQRSVKPKVMMRARHMVRA